MDENNPHGAGWRWGWKKTTHSPYTKASLIMNRQRLLTINDSLQAWFIMHCSHRSMQCSNVIHCIIGTRQCSFFFSPSTSLFSNFLHFSLSLFHYLEFSYLFSVPFLKVNFDFRQMNKSDLCIWRVMKNLHNWIITSFIGIENSSIIPESFPSYLFPVNPPLNHTEAIFCFFFLFYLF